MVNSLLQHIDKMSKDSILIAATNHSELLDKAIWRRFETKIEVEKPDENQIIELLELYLSPVKYRFDNKRTQKVSELLLGLSHSEIETICINSIKKMIIANREELEYGYFIHEIWLNTKYIEEDIVSFMKDSYVVQKEISEVLDISIRQVRNK